MTADDDSTLVSKGPGHRLRGLFTIKAADPKPVKKHVPKLSTGEAVVVKAKSPEAAPPKKEEVPAEPVVAEEPPAVAEDKAAAYVDDNDGSKGGMCAACEGCMIL